MDILSAFALNQLAHTAGHFDRASKEGADISLHGRDLAETWSYKPERIDKKKILFPDIKSRQLVEREIDVPFYAKNPDEVNSNIHGAGFWMQDILGNALNDSTYDKANGIYKLLYLSGLPNRLGNNIDGDVRNLARSSGNRYVNAMLGASVASDLYQYKNPENNARLSFNVMDGAPGMMLNVPLDQYLRPVWNKKDQRK